MLLRQKQRAALLLSTKEMKQILEEQEENKYRADLGLCEIEIPCSVPTYLNQKTCIIHLLKRNEVEGPILFSLLPSNLTLTIHWQCVGIFSCCLRISLYSRMPFLHISPMKIIVNLKMSSGRRLELM